VDTNINVKEVMSRFRNFLNEFKLNGNKDMAGEHYYLRLLQEIKNTKVYFLNVFYPKINNLGVKINRMGKFFYHID